MGDFTKNFSRCEWICECCGFDVVDFELVVVLQDLADHFESSVIISGGNRCFKNNSITPGAAKDSRHMTGQAADIKVTGVDPLEVYAYLNNKYPGKFGLGLYHNRVHVDVRRERARWTVQG